MRLVVTIEHHFRRDAAGRVFPAPPSIVDYSFWQRYLDVFSEVTVLARVGAASDAHGSPLRGDGPGVAFHDLPDYLGPWEYLRWLPTLRRRIREAVATADAFILRVPGAISHLAWRAIRKKQALFAVEVVGDPWDLLSPGAARTLLRPALRRLWSRNQRQMCREASAASYVTREALQRRYPPGPSTWSTSVSSIDLGDGLAESEKLEARIARLRRSQGRRGSGEGPWRVGFVGMLTNLHKAPDVLLRAVVRCLQAGLQPDVALVGEGDCKPEVERLAARLALEGVVRFLGALPSGEPVRAFLDDIDLFVLPSRQEGLPRAMIEAMARGCPCIGSTAGGTPELLSGEDLVPPNDVGALARKIIEVVSDAARMERMARRNWEAAREYAPAVLIQRRREFYTRVRELAGRGAGVSSLTGRVPEAL